MKTNRHYFAYRSFLPEFEAMKRFAAAGIRTICFFPGNTANSLGQPYAQYPSIWNWFSSFNTAKSGTSVSYFSASSVQIFSNSSSISSAL